MTEPILQLDDLTKAYGALKVTDHVSIDVLPGEIHAVIGPNGAGKTTLIGQISGALRPDGGHVRFDGRDVTALPMHARARAGLARSFQITEILGITVPINLEDNERLVVRTGGFLFRRVQLLEFAILVAVHLQDRVLDRMGTDFPMVDRNAQGINQKRNVRMQYKNNGVSRLPTVTLQVGVENGNRSFLGRPFLQKLPGGQNGAIGIRKSSTDQLLKGNMRVMLFGKIADFLGFGFGNLLSESVSQLFKELILAGHCQRIHGRPQLV